VEEVGREVTITEGQSLGPELAGWAKAAPQFQPEVLLGCRLNQLVREAKEMDVDDDICEVKTGEETKPPKKEMLKMPSIVKEKKSVSSTFRERINLIKTSLTSRLAEVELGTEKEWREKLSERHRRSSPKASEPELVDIEEEDGDDSTVNVDSGIEMVDISREDVELVDIEDNEAKCGNKMTVQGTLVCENVEKQRRQTTESHNSPKTKDSVKRKLFGNADLRPIPKLPVKVLSIDDDEAANSHSDSSSDFECQLDEPAMNTSTAYKNSKSVENPKNIHKRKTFEDKASNSFLLAESNCRKETTSGKAAPAYKRQIEVLSIDDEDNDETIGELNEEIVDCF
jgi:hypothetical protein